MKIDERIVKQIAKLAAIELSTNEIQEFTKDLDSILEYIEVLNEVNVENVEPTSHVHGINNAFRDDVLRDSLDRDKALQCSTQTQGSSFKVPRVISSH